MTETPDIKVDNVGKCWEINGVPVGVFCKDLGRSNRQNPEKNSSIHLYLVAHPTNRKWVSSPQLFQWINPTYPIYNWGELTHLRFVGWATISMHHRSPPFRWAQLPQVGDEEVSLFFALDSEGSTCPWGRSDLTTECWQHLATFFWQADFKSHVRQCFECPMFCSIIMPIYHHFSIYIYIWLYPDPPSNCALGLFSFYPIFKKCAQSSMKKKTLEGLGAHLDLLSKAPNQYLPDLMAVEDRCMLCRPQIFFGSRLLDTWRICAIR